LTVFLHGSVESVCSLKPLHIPYPQLYNGIVKVEGEMPKYDLVDNWKNPKCFLRGHAKISDQRRPTKLVQLRGAVCQS
jgi:hypothetical protein